MINPQFFLWAGLIGVLLFLLWQHGTQALSLKNALNRPANAAMRKIIQQSFNTSIALLIIATVSVLSLLFYDYKLSQANAQNAVTSEQVLALQASQEETARLLTEKAAEAERLKLTQTVGNDPNADVKLNEIKQRYEEIFVTHVLLKRCGQIKPEDYHILNSALMRDLASVNGPSRMQYDIITAAKGTVETLYGNMDCNSADILKIIPGYQTYIATLRDQYGM